MQLSIVYVCNIYYPVYVIIYSMDVGVTKSSCEGGGSSLGPPQLKYYSVKTCVLIEILVVATLGKLYFIVYFHVEKENDCSSKISFSLWTKLINSISVHNQQQNCQYDRICLIWNGQENNFLRYNTVVHAKRTKFHVRENCIYASYIF